MSFRFYLAKRNSRRLSEHSEESSTMWHFPRCARDDVLGRELPQNDEKPKPQTVRKIGSLYNIIEIAKVKVLPLASK